MGLSLNVMETNGKRNMGEAVARLLEAAGAKKCWGCGCFHNSLDAIERAMPKNRPPELQDALAFGRSRLAEVKYDCLGCEVCYPPVAMNALNVEAEACPSEAVEKRAGWPPLPGSYSTLRYHAPVAICTLTDEKLSDAVKADAGPEVALVGSCQTENLGIERVVQNTLANPNIRFLIVCGTDSRQAIGHLPGQSMVCLSRWGVDERGRIVGAKGKRPVLRNLNWEAVEHFRRTVEVLDMVGNGRASEILGAAKDCAARCPGPAEPFAQQQIIPTIQGYIPERMTSDPSGYFVVFVDRPRRVLSLEHYHNSGVLNVIIEGKIASELYVPAVERNLLSRLDHAAYLGRELARAEHALASGEQYVQDAAPEQQGRPLRGLPPTPSSEAMRPKGNARGCGTNCGGT